MYEPKTETAEDHRTLWFEQHNPLEEATRKDSEMLVVLIQRWFHSHCGELGWEISVGKLHLLEHDRWCVMIKDANDNVAAVPFLPEFPDPELTGIWGQLDLLFELVTREMMPPRWSMRVVFPTERDQELWNFEDVTYMVGIEFTTASAAEV